MEASAFGKHGLGTPVQLRTLDLHGLVIARSVQIPEFRPFCSTALLLSMHKYTTPQLSQPQATRCFRGDDCERAVMTEGPLVSNTTAAFSCAEPGECSPHQAPTSAAGNTH